MKKKGGLDNYLLETTPMKMRSRFGELLRSHIKKKQENPDWKVPYIPGTRKAWKPKRIKDVRMNSVIWKPIEIRYKNLEDCYFNRYDPNAPSREEALGIKIRNEYERTPEETEPDIEIPTEVKEVKTLEEVDMETMRAQMSHILKTPRSSKLKKEAKEAEENEKLKKRIEAVEAVRKTAKEIKEDKRQRLASKKPKN